jgi:AbrB family looped-hinge helix DNA binding protein
MVTVDSKGRIVLPKEVRERLDIRPGTEVEVRVEDGRVVVDTEPDPERVVDRLESLVAEASAERDPDPPGERDRHARDHAETIRRGAESDG